MMIIQASLTPKAICNGSTKELNEATIMFALKASPLKQANMTHRYIVVGYTISSSCPDAFDVSSGFYVGVSSSADCYVERS